MLWFYGFFEWIYNKCLYNFNWKCWLVWFNSKDFNLIIRFFLGDSNAVKRANQGKPLKEEPNEKTLQALARRQRRFDGLQLLEKTKLNR